MRIRALLLLALPGKLANGQTLAPLTCDAVITPSDSGGGRVGRVAEGPNGRLAWTDGRASEFLIRDATGKVRTVGRSGSGPGDFQRVSQLGWFGDTVWASDGRLPRVTFFSDTGRLLRVETATPQVGWLPRPDGRLVGVGWMPLGTPTPPPFVVVSQHPGELRRDTIKLFTNAPVEQFNLPPAGALNPQPFYFRTVTGESHDGSRFCSAGPDGGATRIECINDRGRSVVNVLLTLKPRPLSEAVYDSMIVLFARGGRTQQGMRDLIKRPRNLPPVMSMLVEPSGMIWLRRSHEYEPVAVWTRLRADGVVRDELSIPKHIRVMSPNDDSFWAATADNDGLETLHKCRIGRQ